MLQFGFNLKTHKIEKMYEYNELVYTFNNGYEVDVLDEVVEVGMKSLKDLMDSIVKDIPLDANVSIKLLDKIREFDDEDLMLIFSIFNASLAAAGKPNNKGYLKSPDRLLRITGSEQSLTDLMNHDFEYRIVEFILVDGQGGEYRWVE